MLARARRAHFFSDPSFSFRDVYWPFNVLCTHHIIAATLTKETERATHDEPFEDSNRSILIRLRVRNRSKELRAFTPVGCPRPKETASACAIQLAATTRDRAHLETL